MATPRVQYADVEAACTRTELFLVFLESAALANTSSDRKLHESLAELKATLSPPVGAGHRAYGANLAQSAPTDSETASASLDASREKLAGALSYALTDGCRSAIIADESRQCSRVAPVGVSSLEHPAGERSAASKVSRASPDKVELARTCKRDILFQAVGNGRLGKELEAPQSDADASACDMHGRCKGPEPSMDGHVAQISTAGDASRFFSNDASLLCMSVVQPSIVGCPSAGLMLRRHSSRVRRTQTRVLPPLAAVPVFRMDLDDEPTTNVRDCSLTRTFAALGAELHRLDGSSVTATQLHLDCHANPKVSERLRHQPHRMPSLLYAQKSVPAAIVDLRRPKASSRWTPTALPFVSALVH